MLNRLCNWFLGEPHIINQEVADFVVSGGGFTMDTSEYLMGLEEVFGNHDKISTRTWRRIKKNGLGC